MEVERQSKLSLRANRVVRKKHEVVRRSSCSLVLVQRLMISSYSSSSKLTKK
jgi:hypothetical protein